MDRFREGVNGRKWEKVGESGCEEWTGEEWGGLPDFDFVGCGERVSIVAVVVRINSGLSPSIQAPNGGLEIIHLVR